MFSVRRWQRRIGAEKMTSTFHFLWCGYVCVCAWVWWRSWIDKLWQCTSCCCYTIGCIHYSHLTIDFIQNNAKPFACPSEDEYESKREKYQIRQSSIWSQWWLQRSCAAVVSRLLSTINKLLVIPMRAQNSLLSSCGRAANWAKCILMLMWCVAP